MKIERLYSNYQEEERLYSTGNEELDDLLERAFCDGYEYAQKEYSKKLTEIIRNNRAKRIRAFRNGTTGKPLTIIQEEPTHSVLNTNIHPKYLPRNERNEIAREAARTYQQVFPKGSNTNPFMYGIQRKMAGIK